MLKRRTVQTLSEILFEMFRGVHAIRTIYRSTNHVYMLKSDWLYDFLYKNDYDSWFMNAAHALHTGDDRALKEFIMRLHTGETVALSTPEWTWLQRMQLGQRLLRDLAEDVLSISQTAEEFMAAEAKKLIPQFTSELELDGYIFRDGKLYFTEAAILDTEGEEGILIKLVKDLALANQEVLKHTLELSETHYLGGKWDDCIANSRRFLEAVLQEAAARYHLHTTKNPISVSLYDHPGEVRNYLQSQGLLEPKEKEAIAKVYGLMSETGSHPYIAERDQARLLRYLALTFAQFALLRLQGALLKRE
jgi:hypothetical protein